MTSNNQIKLEKAAIGLSYWYPYNPGETCLNIRYDKEMITHLKIIEQMWNDVCADPEVVLAQSLIGKGTKKKEEKGIKLDTFFQVMGDLGYTRVSVSELLQKMSRAGLVNYSQDKIRNRDIRETFSSS